MNWIKLLQSKMGTFLTIVFLLVVLTFGVWYVSWQFDLCYPEVSESIWYCIAHAT